MEIDNNDFYYEERNKRWFLTKVGGFCSIFLSFIVFLTFMGHYSANSGWYHYGSNSNIKYYLSTTAIYLSDITMVYMGPIGSLMLSFVLFWWGVTMIIYSRPIISRQFWYLTLLIIFVSALGTALQPLDTWHFPLGWGGYFGDLVYDIIIWTRDVMGLSHLFAWEIGLLTVISLFFLNYALDLDLHHIDDLKNWFKSKIYSIFRVILYIINSVLQFIGSVIYCIKCILSFVKRVIFRRSATNSDPLKLSSPNNKNSIQYLPYEENKESFGYSFDYNNVSSKTYKAGSFVNPTVDLLDPPSAKNKDNFPTESEINYKSKLLLQVLNDFGIEGLLGNVLIGPVVSLFEFRPGPGIKVSKIASLETDIARSLSVTSARVSVIPETDIVGIEIPNKYRQIVYAKELYSNKVFSANTAQMTLALGKKTNGDPMFVDLSKMPHLLVAGTTGSGKSVSINTMILSLLYRMSPEDCRMILIDPKRLELSVYNDIPHLLMPVITDPKKAVLSLKWAIEEMERRYSVMSSMGVRNIANYNELAKKRGTKVQVGYDSANNRPLYKNFSENLKTMPYIVIVIDELADLMLVAGKEIEDCVQRLAQMARAAGIHMIVATQRPSVDVITGVIKANFPIRISFQVSSGFDSKTIIGQYGAETLLGKGDMLLMQGAGRLSRVHGCFVSDHEVNKVISFLKQQGTANFMVDLSQEEENLSNGGGFNGSSDDSDSDLYNSAVELVISKKKCSTSFIQRYFQIGYNRAARIVEKMELDGLVSSADHVGRRKILGISNTADPNTDDEE